jgi:hypothetical protein
LRGLQDHRDHRATKESQDPRVTKEPRETLAHRERAANRDRKVRVDLVAPPVNRETRDPSALREKRDRQGYPTSLS